MADFTIYHNPRCSKSRQTLELLRDNGVEPDVVTYLETPPDAATLRDVVKKLGLAHAHDLIRTQEDAYAQSGLTAESGDDAVIDAMTRWPKLIERPVVTHGDRAVLGRPPENVLDLIKR